MIIRDALAAAVRRLEDAGIEGAAGDARRLMAAALGVGADRITLMLPDDLPPAVAARFDAMIARRAAREPVSHIAGQRSFFGRMFEVGPDVLDPRPETEELIAAALQVPFGRVLDLGTGSGCIVAALLAERGVDAYGIGTDMSAAALAVAARNAARLGVADRVQFLQGDWFGAVPTAQVDFDLIVSNPPYIAADEMLGLDPDVRDYEPRMALTDEADGLRAYARIVPGAFAHLRPRGWLMMEIGPTQAAAVMGMLQDAGFGAVTVRPDLDGRDRVVIGQKPA